MVEGDAKNYINFLQCIKTEYRDEMDYFLVTGVFLIKIYFNGEIKKLAKASSCNSNSVQTNFKHTHNLTYWKSTETILAK